MWDDPLVESYSLQHPVHLYHLLRGPCWFWWAKTRTVLGQNAINETSLGQIEVPRYLPDLTKKNIGNPTKTGYIADPICGATSTSAIDPLGLQARMPGCKTAHASSEASRCGHEANSSRRGASMGYPARWSCKAQHKQWQHRIYRFAWKIITIWPFYYNELLQ